jgi:hypothetical protein
MFWHRWVVAVSVATVGAACSLVVDVENGQCEVSADCAELGHPELQCVDSVCSAEGVPAELACRSIPWIPASATETVATEVFARALNEAPVPDLQIQVCDTLNDPGCASPLAQSTTDASGVAKLDVLQGFRGHLFLPSLSAQQAPYIVHMNPPPDPEATETLRTTITVTDLATMRGIATVGGRVLIEGRGHLFFTTPGCDFRPLSGVRLEIGDPAGEVVVAYLGTNGLPDLGLQSSGASGRGAVINLQPGFVTVRAYHDAVGKIFEQAMLVAADTITSSQIVPSLF